MNKNIKQIFGKKEIKETATHEISIHYVKNVTVTYDKELFRKDNKVMIKINIEHGDIYNESKSHMINNTIVLFCDNEVTK